MATKQPDGVPPSPLPYAHAPDHDSVRDFAELSAVLTGFTPDELMGTGVAELYYNTLIRIIGERIVGRMLITWHSIRERIVGRMLIAWHPTDDRPSPVGQLELAVDDKICRTAMMGPVARNIVAMWYVGNWNQMPRAWRQKYGASAEDETHVISARAYQEGLVWTACDAHPPAAKQMGFGSWTRPPPGAEEIDDEWKAVPLPKVEGCDERGGADS